MTLRDTFDRLRARDEMALMPYVMAGYPSLDQSLEILADVAGSGTDIIEIGVPFSDSVADGVTIEAAGHAALANGFRLGHFVERLRHLRIDCPTVLMSYLNPLLAYGRDRLLDDATRANVVGLIIPDLLPEDAGDWKAACNARGIVPVFLVAPTSTDERIRRIASESDGFIYAVSVLGTTGTRAELDDRLPDYLRRLKRCTDKPVAVGFGISRPKHVRSLRGLADGAVIGSRLVEAIRAGDDIAELIRSFKRATRG